MDTFRSTIKKNGMHAHEKHIITQDSSGDIDIHVKVTVLCNGSQLQLSEEEKT